MRYDFLLLRLVERFSFFFSKMEDFLHFSFEVNFLLKKIYTRKSRNYEKKNIYPHNFSLYAMIEITSYPAKSTE